RELDRVREQVADDLLEPRGFAARAQELRLKPHADPRLLRLRVRARELDGGGDDRGEVDAADLERELPGGDPRHVEEVVDQARLQADAPDDRLVRGLAAVGGERARLEEAR